MIKQVKTADIKPYPQNTKIHDAVQIRNVATSIQEYGFIQPIVIDRENVVVIGHCRLEAAKLLEMETVPCVQVDDLTPEQVNALRIVDNKTNESAWDYELLAAELPNIDLSMFDFDFGDMPEIELDLEDIQEDEPPEPDEETEPITKKATFGSLAVII